MTRHRVDDLAQRRQPVGRKPLITGRRAAIGPLLPQRRSLLAVDLAHEPQPAPRAPLEQHRQLPAAQRMKGMGNHQ